MNRKYNLVMFEKLHALYPSLYGSVYDESQMDRRYMSLVEGHEKLFSRKNPMLFSASGRTEIAGNHTDHNLGLVIGASINLDTIAAVTKRDDNTVIFISEGFPECRVDLSDTEIHEDEKNSTAAVLRGIAKAFMLRGVTVGGWQANVSSTVAVGSGLSSSASVEVLIAEIFNSLYNNDAYPPLEIARISQYAENTYFGKPSGLLDQATAATGGVIAIDFRDRDNPVLERLDFNLQDYDLSMIITNTQGCHSDLTAEYASIPPEMRAVASFFGKENLREVEFRDFLGALPEIRKTIANDRALLRAYHFFTENERVRFMREEIAEGDIDTFLYNVNESGSSSFCFLQNVYSANDPKEQGLALAIALSQNILMGEGAVRLHGGGFAGTVQAYVPKHLVRKYITEMEKLFGDGACTLIAFRKADVMRLV